MLEILGALEDVTARWSLSGTRRTEALDGSCRTPIAAFARVADGRLRLLARR